MSASRLVTLVREYRRMLLWLLLLGSVSVAVWGYLLGPQRQQREQVQERWSEKRRQLHELGRGDGADRQQRARQRLDSLLATIPTRNEFPRVLGHVTDVAAVHGATVSTLTYRPLPPAIEGMAGYALSVGVTGSYEEVKPVLAELQNLNALAYVETASLVNPDPRTERLSLEVRMVLHLRPEVPP